MADTTFLEDLLEHGHLVRTPVDGVYGYSGEFVDLIFRIEHLYLRMGREPNGRTFYFPPVISRSIIATSQFLNSFPQLLGTVAAFEGSSAKHAELTEAAVSGKAWPHQEQTDLALTPAACYHLYPIVLRSLPPEGYVADVTAHCFRHEPSMSAGRMQSFRQHEFVRLGDEATIWAWRDMWVKRARELFDRLGTEPVVAPASDPFFGRSGRLLGAMQAESGQKIEVSLPIDVEDEQVAVLSVNYHRDHFGETFGIQAANGKPAHSCCVGIGLDRSALALCRQHGLDLQSWPQEVRGLLWG